MPRLRRDGTFELMTMRRQVTFEHPEALTTSIAIDVVPARQAMSMQLWDAWQLVSMWRAGELVAACTRDLLQSAFTFWKREMTPPLGFLVYVEEDDDISDTEVDLTMMWAVKRIDSVKHNMC